MALEDLRLFFYCRFGGLTSSVVTDVKAGWDVQGGGNPMLAGEAGYWMTMLVW
jgi:hypothetical protein